RHRYQVLGRSDLRRILDQVIQRHSQRLGQVIGKRELRLLNPTEYPRDRGLRKPYFAGQSRLIQTPQRTKLLQSLWISHIPHNTNCAPKFNRRTGQSWRSRVMARSTPSFYGIKGGLNRQGSVMGGRTGHGRAVAKSAMRAEGSSLKTASTP